MARSKGDLNKTTVVLKDAILLAATRAGGAGGLVEYLYNQAMENPNAFIPLLGKVLPREIKQEGEVKHVHEIVERAILNAPERKEDEWETQEGRIH